MRIINFVSNRLQQMPYGLRVVSRVLLGFAILIPIMTVLSMLSGNHGHYSINGKSVSYDEFFHRGGFVMCFLIGIYCAVLVYGFLCAHRWSRLLCFLPLAISLALALIHPPPSPGLALYTWVSLSLAVAFLVWYLFFHQPVKNY